MAMCIARPFQMQSGLIVDPKLFIRKATKATRRIRERMRGGCIPRLDESLQVTFCFVAVKLSRIVEQSRPVSGSVVVHKV